jgi:hypothetical protein
MHASECKRYADICFQLARELPPHRALLLEMAEKWLMAAEELERDEGQRGARAPDSRR